MWTHKLNLITGKKLWLDPQNKKLLLCDHGGLRSREFHYTDIRTVEFSEASDEKKITINTHDADDPAYVFATSGYGFFFPFWYTFGSWKARLESQLNLSPTIRVKGGNARRR